MLTKSDKTRQFIIEKAAHLFNTKGFSEQYVWVEGIITDEAGRTVKAVLWTRLYHVSTLTGEKAKHSEHLMELFPKILNENIDTRAGLKNRVSQLISPIVSA